MKRLFEIKKKLGTQDGAVLLDAIVLIAALEAQLILNQAFIKSNESDIDEINNLLEQI